MKLIIGTGSTWSLRVWICARIAELPLEEHVIDLTQSNYKEQISQHSVTGLVPVLTDDGVVVHDSLAIMEYLNECSGGALLPKKLAERAQARSLCAELHSGFIRLRSTHPFTLGASAAPVINDQALDREIARIQKIFEQAKRPYMFDRESAVDAFYSVLAFRLRSYGIQLTADAGDYQDSLLSWPYLQEAIAHWKTFSEG